jgi:hypothetical protein
MKSNIYCKPQNGLEKVISFFSLMFLHILSNLHQYVSTWTGLCYGINAALYVIYEFAQLLFLSFLCREKIVCSGDCVDVASQMKVEVFHWDNLDKREFLTNIEHLYKIITKIVAGTQHCSGFTNFLFPIAIKKPHFK